MIDYLDSDVAEKEPQSWRAPASTAKGRFEYYDSDQTTPSRDHFNLRFFEDHWELESERVNWPLNYRSDAAREEVHDSAAQEVNPYSRTTLGLIKWGIVALAVAAMAMPVAVLASMTAVAFASLLSLFFSMVLLGEAQRRARLERSFRETGRPVRAS